MTIWLTCLLAASAAGRYQKPGEVAGRPPHSAFWSAPEATFGPPLPALRPGPDAAGRSLPSAILPAAEVLERSHLSALHTAPRLQLGLRYRSNGQPPPPRD
jgi:hypothetical protein